ncbi:hypothetical protein BDY19DRAFT_934062 [Irpex rosettiformis]|uniref:Uncharacterized protein n=1 Tax=Irpex rosettiformis TaxID=378272 RepID=A0ACB8UA69_9APHY|nr:hypothetical protein BDY19DRAFT_934062 [Irpex rosettiformis]
MCVAAVCSNVTAVVRLQFLFLACYKNIALIRFEVGERVSHVSANIYILYLTAEIIAKCVGGVWCIMQVAAG